MKNYFLCLLFIFLKSILLAQPGMPDSSFSNDGKTETHVGNGSAQGYAVAIQNNGKIIVAGFSYNGSNYDFSLVRYKKNGMPDSLFGINGKVLSDFGSDDKGYSVAIQTDKKIVVGGVSVNDFALARYEQNGKPDSTFGMNGYVITDLGGIDNLSAITLQTDGKILAAGSSNGDVAIVRYKQNGKPDNSFGVNGKVFTDFGSAFDNGEALAITSQGKILASGYFFNGLNNDFILSQYNADGKPDKGFGKNGKVITDLGGNDKAHSVAIQDGKIIEGGFYSTQDSSFYFALVRYKSNGKIDSSFGNDGKTFIHAGKYGVVRSVILQTDGKIIETGSADGDFILMRFTQDGTPDNSFGIHGKVITDFGNEDRANSVALQADGKIVAAGSSLNKFAVARYYGDYHLIAKDKSHFFSGKLIKSNTVLLSSDYCLLKLFCVAVLPYN